MALGVELPITADSGDGFTMLYSIRRTLHQNFKMLILTNPGERVMEPNFGVGIKQFLFANYTSDYRAQISARIQSQVQRYMPAIVVRSIDYLDTNPDRHKLAIRITYSIPDVGIKDLLEITI